MKLTLSMVKTAVGRVLDMNPSDSRVVEYVNRAVERLLESGKWKGVVHRYRVCASESCLVLPRQLETVESFALECAPGVVRNSWFEFLGAGPGIQNEDGCLCNTLIQGDEVASFDQVRGTGKKLVIYNDVAESAGGYVIVRFYDKNAKWVRTQDAGSWIDGQKLAISTTAGQYVYTTDECMDGGFVAAIKTKTNGIIRLYEYTVSNGALKPLAYYEPDEEVPRYRSVLIPGLKTIAADGGSSCAKKTVVIRGKARFIPVASDNDFLQIESVEAIRLACQAVAKEEKDLFDDAAKFWAMAFRVLDNQLAHFQGSGARQPINVHEAGVSGPNVLNLV
jgi:hypothetical protein